MKTTQRMNVGILERVIRVAGGGFLVVVSLALLVGGSSLWASGLEIAGTALGLDFVYTGTTGYCPLYNRLGWRTARPRRSS
jgi:hypothetical protein